MSRSHKRKTLDFDTRDLLKSSPQDLVLNSSYHCGDVVLGVMDTPKHIFYLYTSSQMLYSRSSILHSSCLLRARWLSSLDVDHVDHWNIRWTFQSLEWTVTLLSHQLGYIWKLKTKKTLKGLYRKKKQTKSLFRAPVAISGPPKSALNVIIYDAMLCK